MLGNLFNEVNKVVRSTNAKAVDSTLRITASWKLTKVQVDKVVNIKRITKISTKKIFSSVVSEQARQVCDFGHHKNCLFTWP